MEGMEASFELAFSEDNLPLSIWLVLVGMRLPPDPDKQPRGMRPYRIKLQTLHAQSQQIHNMRSL